MSKTGAVRKWRVDDGTPLGHFGKDHYRIEGVSVSPFDQRFVSISQRDADPDVVVWAMGSPSTLADL